MLQTMVRNMVLLAMFCPVLLHASDVNLQNAVDAIQTGAYQDGYGQLVQLSRAGNRDAQTLLGIIYNEGLGVVRDSQKARYWYQCAAEKGKVDAAFLLGLSYLNEDTVPGDSAAKHYAKAVYWIKYAARQDNLHAQRFMALAYEKGWMNIPVSDWKSQYWWRRYEKLNALKSNLKKTLPGVALASSVQSMASHQRQSLHVPQRD